MNKELATIRAHIEALEADNTLLRSDAARVDACPWRVQKGATALCQPPRRMDDALARAEAAEARVRELEGDAVRYRWLREGSIPKLCIRADRHAGLHNVRMMGSEADAAIDSAMQGEEVRGG